MKASLSPDAKKPPKLSGAGGALAPGANDENADPRTSAYWPGFAARRQIPQFLDLPWRDYRCGLGNYSGVNRPRHQEPDRGPDPPDRSKPDYSAAGSTTYWQRSRKQQPAVCIRCGTYHLFVAA